MSQQDQIQLMLKNLTDFVKANFKSDAAKIEKVQDKLELVNNRIVNVEKSIIGLEFKHNWKTAFWVFVATMMPVTGGIFVLWATVLKKL